MKTAQSLFCNASKNSLILIAAMISTLTFAQVRQHTAKRTFSPPKIDGYLSDSVWAHAPVAKDFLTNEPVFGKEPGQKTEVRFLYDDEAIYAAYYLYDTEPSKIISLLNERDRTILADEMMMGIDTYNDKTSAFRFQVTAAGVQTDRVMSPFIPNSDKSWDAVWQSAVSIDDCGWYVEMRIPFTALRFPKKDIQEWGIQFGRYVGRTGEFTTWSPVNPNIGGGPMRQWGLLQNVKNVKPKVRLSLWPYFTLGWQRNSASASGNNINRFTYTPFYSGGMDLKYGINQSYTLDMTLVPDFSQVQSDNTILNLTPFEIKYDERRQFFTEGTDMFNKAGIFYSRRIGSTPSGYSSLQSLLLTGERILDNPSIARLINATKVSGRNNRGFGIGILNAVSEKTFAEVHNDSTGESRTITTEPASNYNVLVFDQSLKNNSKIGVINTHVARGNNGIDANVSALDFILNSKGNIYSLSGTGIYSQRTGVSLTDGRQTGYNYKLDFAKVSRNFRFQASIAAVSENYNPNDLGILTETNLIQNFMAVRYFSFKPKGRILNRSSSLSYLHTLTLKDRSFQKSDIEFLGYLLFSNFSTVNLATNWNPRRGNDIYEPRTNGKYFVRPMALKSFFKFSTDKRKKSQVQFSASAKWFEFPADHFYFDVGVTPLMRFGNNFIVSLTTLYAKQTNNLGFAFKSSHESPVFGLRQENSFENIVLLQYLFSQYSNLSFRVRDYWSRIRFDQYYNLEADGYLIPTLTNGNADANLNIFNIDMIYTWQYGPGSFLSLSWKTNLNQNTKSREDDYFASLSDALNAAKNTSLSVRVIYYLDYLKIKRVFGRKI